MTKVQLQYDLLHPLNDALFNRIAAIHSVYGMTRVQPGDNPSVLLVEYDASRLTETQVEHNLHRAGIPVKKPNA